VGGSSLHQINMEGLKMKMTRIAILTLTVSIGAAHAENVCTTMAVFDAITMRGSVACGTDWMDAPPVVAVIEKMKSMGAPKSSAKPNFFKRSAVAKPIGIDRLPSLDMLGLVKN
jgi:hypothetical protein